MAAGTWVPGDGAAVWSRSGRHHLQLCRESLGKGEQGQQAPGPLVVMQQSGVVPSVVTFDAAVSAWEKGALMQQSLGLWR